MSAEAELRAIEARDDRPLRLVLEPVMREFGALRDSDSPDPELGSMAASYSVPRAAYFVAEIGGCVVGGAGIGPLADGPDEVCELRKMYLAPGARGHGLGRRLLARCLEAARAHGYRQCFLQTMGKMTQAQQLYAGAGFRRVETPPGGGAGICGSACDTYYLSDL